MKRLTCVIALALALVSASALIAQPAPFEPPAPGMMPQMGPMHHGGGHGEGGMFAKFHGFFKMLDELNISNQQLSDLRGLYQKHHAVAETLKKEMHDNHVLLGEFMKSGTDIAAGQKIAEKQGELIRKMIIDHMEMRIELSKVLTFEQQAKLHEMMEKHEHARMHGQEQGGMPWQGMRGMQGMHRPNLAPGFFFRHRGAGFDKHAEPGVEKTPATPKDSQEPGDKGH